MLRSLAEAALWIGGYVAACFAVALAAGQMHDRYRVRTCPFCDAFLTDPTAGCRWCARNAFSPSQEEGTP